MNYSRMQDELIILSKTALVLLIQHIILSVNIMGVRCKLRRVKVSVNLLRIMVVIINNYMLRPVYSLKDVMIMANVVLSC